MQEPDIGKTLGLERSSVRTRRLKRLLIIAGVLIVGGISLVIWRRSNENASLPKYKTQAAERGNMVVTVSATGTLEPTNQVEVGSELSGIIETVEVDYNDHVKVGQVLARLDPEKLNAQVIRSEAALESARAMVLQAQADVMETRSKLDRLKQVWEKSDKKVPSQYDLDQAEAAFERAQSAEAAAKAQVSEAQATLDSNRTDLGKTIIRSPINGIVLTREVEPGQTVAASLQAPILFTLAEDLTKMELQVDVDEADVGQVEEGQAATFTVDAYPDMNFQATVTEVRYGSQTLNGVVTYKTILNVDNSGLLLRPGMTATANIMVKKIEDALLIPNVALRFSPPVQQQMSSSGGSMLSKLLPRPPGRSSSGQNESLHDKAKNRVWTLRDGNPVAIPITIGLTDGQMTEVLTGNVEPGMELLVDMGESGK